MRQTRRIDLVITSARPRVRRSRRPSAAVRLMTWGMADRASEQSASVGVRWQDSVSTSVSIQETTVRRCLFCGSTGPMTREHVIPRWMSRVYHDDSGPRSYFTMHHPQEPPQGTSIAS